MVVSNRLAHLRRLVEQGAEVVVNVSSNPDSGNEKLKLFIDPSKRIEPTSQQCILPCLKSFSKRLGVTMLQIEGIGTLLVFRKSHSIFLIAGHHLQLK